MTDTPKTLVADAASQVTFRANSDFHRTWNHQGVLVVTWRDGAVQTFNPAKASPSTRAKAAQHGFEQRIGDSAALEIDKIPAKAERVQAKKDAMQRLIDHYESGADEWNIRVAARVAGPRGPDAGLILRGMMRGLDVDLEGAEWWVRELMNARGVERTAALVEWSKTDKVRAAILAIQAEKIPPKTAEDLMAELVGQIGKTGAEEAPL